MRAEGVGLGFHHLLSIGSGISETRADRYMGHSNPSVAARYRHLLPGQLAEDAKRVDEYIAGAIAGKLLPLEKAIA